MLLGMTVLVDYEASRLPQNAAEGSSTFHFALLVYILCIIAALILLVLGSLSMFLVLMNAAYKVLILNCLLITMTLYFNSIFDSILNPCSFQVHNKMVSCVTKAPQSFHTSHPVGQILNRFSQDINNLDELLPFNMFIASVFSAPTAATIILAVLTNPVLIIPILISLPAYYFISKIYLTAASDMKRLMSVAGSPVYSHFSNTVNGIRNIRVYGRQKEFTDEVFRYASFSY